VGEFKDHRLADDAQYLIGNIFYKYKNDPSQAHVEFSKVDAEFPSGDMRPKARKMLNELGAALKKKDKTKGKRRAQAPDKSPNEAAILLKEADQGRRSLYRSAKKKRYRHNWLNSIGRYERLYKRYPKSDQAPWALYHSARLFTGLYTCSGRSKDLDEAVTLYRRLMDEYQDHRLADDAQYGIGEVFYKHKNDSSQAYVEFLKVDIKFPSGDMRPKARNMLDELEVVLSKKDVAKDIKSSAPSKSGLVPVKDIRHWSTPNYTRVVIDLEAPVKYEHHLLKPDPDLKKPRRLYLDLKNARVTAKIDRPKVIKDGLLRRARAGQYTRNTVRVVLDMESIGGYDVFRLHDPFRIVVDVKRIGRKGVEKLGVSDGPVSIAKQLGLNVKRVVIDPGHGGKDPGCRTRGGAEEKDIVLSMAKILARKIEKEMGCEVFLTRTKDIFLSLERRTAIANTKNADLFISLHINAHKSKDISGLETYFLNVATDERAMTVAARENATSEKNISDLQSILNSLLLNTKIHESSRLAREVQEGMVSQVNGKYKQAKSLGVKQAPFYVLIGAQMPAILVETGFLTNLVERKRLLSAKYQECVAAGICSGIRSYVKSIDQIYQGG
jgi:N-acetylmuramoyl-L-alanine amidase